MHLHIKVFFLINKVQLIFFFLNSTIQYHRGCEQGTSAYICVLLWIGTRDNQHVGTGVNRWCHNQQLDRHVSRISNSKSFLSRRKRKKKT